MISKFSEKVVKVVLFSALAGCSAQANVVSKTQVGLTDKELVAVRSSVEQSMIDPRGMRLRGLYGVDTTLKDGQTWHLVCGEVNGRNRFGGFTGFESFGGFLASNVYAVEFIGKDLVQYVGESPALAVCRDLP